MEESLRAAWDDATAPLDVRVRKDTLPIALDSETVAVSRLKREKQSRSNQIGDVCRPWEHGDFLSRVDSFSIAWWFAKPDRINAFECARHGWKNVASDQLQCTCCKRFVCFTIDHKLTEFGELKVVTAFADQLVTGHAQLCPWRGNPSPAAFMLLPITTKRQVCEMLICRLDEEIVRMHNDTEFQKQMEKFEISDSVKANILQEASGTGNVAASLDTVLTSKLFARTSKQEDVSVNPEALVNAVFLITCGWKFDEKDGSQTDILCCGSCNRRWQAFQGAASKESVGKGEPPAKRLKAAADRSVDLLTQHRHFCPWIVGRKSTGEDDYGEINPKLWEFVKLPGWKQNAQALVLLGHSEDSAIVAINTSDATEKDTSDPVQALATIQAVLGL